MRKYLRDIRKKLRLSQQSVAEKLGITSQYYSLIENGDRQQKMSIDFLVTDPCYIKSIHGMFGRNWFKWIESVLRDNHLIT